MLVFFWTACAFRGFFFGLCLTCACYLADICFFLHGYYLLAYVTTIGVSYSIFLFRIYNNYIDRVADGFRRPFAVQKILLLSLVRITYDI